MILQKKKKKMRRRLFLKLGIIKFSGQNQTLHEFPVEETKQNGWEVAGDGTAAGTEAACGSWSCERGQRGQAHTQGAQGSKPCPAAAWLHWNLPITCEFCSAR